MENLKKQYQIDKIIVVTDRGMLSKNKIPITTARGYEFIIGERLKTLLRAIQNTLLDLSNYTYEWIYKADDDEPVIIKYTTP